MSKLFLTIIQAIVAAMYAILTPEMVKNVLDKAFDAAEIKIKASSTAMDDLLILPILATLRTAFNVPQDVPIETPTAETPVAETPAETPAS